MTEIIQPLNDMLKTGELNGDKYHEVLTNNDYCREILFREVIRNSNYSQVSNTLKKKYIFVPTFNELIESPTNENSVLSMLKNDSCQIDNLWLSCDGYLNLGCDMELTLSQLSSDDIIKYVSNKNELEEANNYLYSFDCLDVQELKKLLEHNTTRYITIPIALHALYVNMSLYENNAGHIGLYVIDKQKMKAYFFDPNGQPSYFDKLKMSFKTKVEENQEETINTERNRMPRDIFDDINMTFEEFSFLTGRNIMSHDTIINNILKSYTKLISTKIEFITSTDFYKFIPNSNMLSASFDKGSCVTWTLILDNIIHKNEKLTYEEIINNLCKLSLIDSQRICYQYQNGLYDIMQKDKMIGSK